MVNILFNKKHVAEYAIYGGIAGILHVFTVWYFLYQSNYHTSPVLFVGTVFFMFVIMIYALKLTRREPENYSVWVMIIVGQIAVAVGIVISVISSFILCCFYIPAFVDSGGTDRFPHYTSSGVNSNYSYTLEIIFMTATIGNYMAGAFISAMVAYAIKPNQTRDETPMIFEEPAGPKIL